MSLLKNYCWKSTNCAAFSLFFLLFISFCAHAEQEWKRLFASHFQIIYQKDDSKNAISLLATLNAAAPKISEKVGVPLPDTVFVIIASSEKEYRQFTGKNFPKWSQALASPSENLILLKSPRFLHLDSGYEKIAVHELTHILLNQAVRGQPIPRWLNEGIAVYFSREKAFASNSLVSKALLTNSIIPLAEIDNVLSFHAEKAQLAYQESYLAVRFLFEHFGDEKVKSILQQLSNGSGIQNAMYYSIGLSFNQFEQLWLEKISKSQRWQFLMDFDNYLWLFVLLIFLIGVFVVRKRNQAKIKQWEEDDFDEIDTI